MEAEALPPGTSAQKAELIVLSRALHLPKSKKVNIYTNSKYAFSVAHVCGAIWKEKGLLTAGNKEIKHVPKLLHLLEAILKPKELSIIHYPEHQKSVYNHKGNTWTDQAAKLEAKNKAPQSPLYWL